MQIQPIGGRFFLARALGLIALAVILVLLLAHPALAVGFKKGKLYGSWDTTVSYGFTFRLEDPDPALFGTANGGEAFSVNGDDGNLNYDTGLVSNAIQVTSELELQYENFGAFVRGRGFYDHENEDGDRERTELSGPAKDRVGSRTELLDAFVWAKFEIGNSPAEVRIGEQVISWGESTFIQNSINAINPIDVSALRVPGAELRDALLPEGLVWASFSLTRNTGLEAFYQYDWDETEIDPPGSYFSTTDLAGDGGELVFLGFGDFGDLPPYANPLDPLRPFLGVPRTPDRRADDTGQYGLALRWFVPAMRDTEFGFYFMNVHSRLPLINGRTGTQAGAINASGVGAATTASLTTLAMGGSPEDAIANGIAAGSSVPGASSETVDLVTGVTPLVVGTAVAGGNGAAVGSGFATDAFAQTASYFLAYPEDVKIYGIGFNTELGTTGVALQGEVSLRKDAPLQVDDVELLFAALSPISPVFAGTSGIPGEPGASQLGGFGLETDIPGFIRRDVSQIQATATKVFGPGLGASQAVLVWEGAYTHVRDMPDKDELRLEGPATYTSGNPYHEVVGNPGVAHPGKPAESPDHFADANSWGYRLAGRLDYNAAIGAVNLSPRFSWQHDVSGVSPGPGGNFIEDRKAVTVGVNLAYQNTWTGDLSYTRYFGAGRHNLIGDRDFVAANIKYSF